MKQHKERYSLLCEHLTRRGIDVHAVKDRLKAQVIELPSWAVGNSGTRYGTFADKGAAVTVWDRIDDCAEIQRCLGITPRMATHVCWDKTDDGNYIPVKQYAEDCSWAPCTPIHSADRNFVSVPCARPLRPSANRQKLILRTACASAAN